MESTCSQNYLTIYLKLSVNVLITMHRLTQKGFFKIHVLKGKKAVGEVRGTEAGDDERRTVARCGRPNFPFHVDTTAVETGHHHTTDPLKPKRSTSTRPQRVIHG